MDLKKAKMPQLEYLKHYSNSEKIFLLYTFLLVILLVALPLFKTGSLSSSETVTYGFFSLGMIKTNILALIVLVTLIGWNLSANIRQSLSKFVGFRSNDAFVNFFCLFTLILLMFGIGDTVGMIESNFSQRVGTTSSYYILLIYLVLGLIVAGYLAYQSSTQALYQEEKIEVPHEEDIRESEAFRKVEEEFSGLFEEKQTQSTPPHTPPPAKTDTTNNVNVSDYLR